MKDYDFLEPAQIELEEEVNYYTSRGRVWVMNSPGKSPIPSVECYATRKPGPSFPKEPAGAEPKDFPTESFTRSEATGS